MCTTTTDRIAVELWSARPQRRISLLQPSMPSAIGCSGTASPHVSSPWTSCAIWISTPAAHTLSGLWCSPDSGKSKRRKTVSVFGWGLKECDRGSWIERVETVSRSRPAGLQRCLLIYVSIMASRMRQMHLLHVSRRSLCFALTIRVIKRTWWFEDWSL